MGHVIVLLRRSKQAVEGQRWIRQGGCERKRISEKGVRRTKRGKECLTCGNGSGVDERTAAFCRTEGNPSCYSRKSSIHHPPKCLQHSKAALSRCSVHHLITLFMQILKTHRSQYHPCELSRRSKMFLQTEPSFVSFKIGGEAPVTRFEAGPTEHTRPRYFACRSPCRRRSFTAELTRSWSRGMRLTGDGFMIGCSRMSSTDTHSVDCRKEGEIQNGELKECVLG